MKELLDEPVEGFVQRIGEKLKLGEEEKAKKRAELRLEKKRLEHRYKILDGRKTKIQEKMGNTIRKLNKNADQLRHLDRYTSVLVSEAVMIKYLRDYHNIDIMKMHDEITALPSNKVVHKGTKIVDLVD